MQSHLDSDSPQRREFRKKWLDELANRAEKIREQERSTITGGRDGEPVISEWTHNGIGIRQLPSDDMGILRISIGGGNDTPVVVNYCVFRGDHGKCVDLLRRALAAMEEGPQYVRTN